MDSLSFHLVQIPLVRSSAAKEETFSAFGPWCAETCISASECEGEKPHQGVAGKNPALHLGITWSNSTTALGLREVRSETRIRSRCTGKERDTESGLDMFGARYYGSSLGRFMTPDWAAKPIDVPYANFGNPQSLNLYSYVNNNPTTTRDPDGHCAEDGCVIEGSAALLYIGGAALVAGTAAVSNTPAGQRSVSTFTSAASQSISDTVHAIGNFFHPDNSGKAASPPGTTTTNVATGTPASTSQQGAVNNDPINSKTLEPGLFAGAGVPARGPERDFTPSERDAINEQGRDTGCHTCGSTDPGTKSGNFVPDHQPPSALNTTGASQTLYPHCLGCSQTQGGEVNAAKQKPPNQNQ